MTEERPDYAVTDHKGLCYFPFSEFIVVPLSTYDLSRRFAVATDKGLFCGMVRVPVLLDRILGSRKAFNDEVHRQVLEIIDAVKDGRCVPAVVPQGAEWLPTGVAMTPTGAAVYHEGVEIGRFFRSQSTVEVLPQSVTKISADPVEFSVSFTVRLKGGQ